MIAVFSGCPPWRGKLQRATVQDGGDQKCWLLLHLLLAGRAFPQQDGVHRDVACREIRLRYLRAFVVENRGRNQGHLTCRIGPDWIGRTARAGPRFPPRRHEDHEEEFGDKQRRGGRRLAGEKPVLPTASATRANIFDLLHLGLLLVEVYPSTAGNQEKPLSLRINLARHVNGGAGSSKLALTKDSASPLLLIRSQAMAGAFRNLITESVKHA